MSQGRIRNAKHARSMPRSAWDAATAGTYSDRCVPRAFVACVLAVALAALCLPLVGMLWARTDVTTENRELAGLPVLVTQDGAFNCNVLADAGAYFEDHFAYRNQLVDANARLRAALGSSPTEQVVVGSDGWLYYGGTLPDYLGQSAMTERALRNVAHNLGLVQRYVRAHGAAFAFTLAPNKNGLYPQHMPYYYVRTLGPSNAERLKPYLEEEGVNYVDLFDLFEAENARGAEASGVSAPSVEANEANEAREAAGGGDAADRASRDGDVWYLKRDTHWDNRGALLATQVLLAAVGREPMELSVDDARPRDDFVGDLQNMLFPAHASTETNWYFEGYNDGPGFAGERWSYVDGADVTDATIKTVASGAQDDSGRGNLLMFRDSFGNALVPLWATQFSRSTFSKLVPYDVGLAGSGDVDAVIVERAERHVGLLAETAPLMPSASLKKAPAVDPAAVSGTSGGDSDTAATTLETSKNGPYTLLSGVVDAALADDASRILVSVEYASGRKSCYNAFWTSVGEGAQRSDFGYQVNLIGAGARIDGATACVLVSSSEGTLCAGTFRLGE